MPVNTKVQVVTIRMRIEVPDTFHPFRDTKRVLGEYLSRITGDSAIEVLPGADISVKEGWHR